MIGLDFYFFSFSIFISFSLVFPLPFSKINFFPHQLMRGEKQAFHLLSVPPLCPFIFLSFPFLFSSLTLLLFPSPPSLFHFSLHLSFLFSINILIDFFPDRFFLLSLPLTLYPFSSPFFLPISPFPPGGGEGIKFYSLSALQMKPLRKEMQLDIFVFSSRSYRDLQLTPDMRLTIHTQINHEFDGLLRQFRRDEYNRRLGR